MYDDVYSSFMELYNMIYSLLYRLNHCEWMILVLICLGRFSCVEEYAEVPVEKTQKHSGLWTVLGLVCHKDIHIGTPTP